MPRAGVRLLERHAALAAELPRETRLALEGSLAAAIDPDTAARIAASERGAAEAVDGSRTVLGELEPAPGYGMAPGVTPPR